MSQFHEKTLALLGNEGVRQERSVQILIDWAKDNQIILPAAYLEWARIDDGSLLQKYSNDDWFYFDEPELVETPEGIRGLKFHSENQNNFDRIVALDKGDDPPVFFAWIGRSPWVMNAERFSEALFAQIFDWQYWLEFKPNDPAYKEITYYGELRADADHCLDVLRQRYRELVTTQEVIEQKRYVEYRFCKSPALRLTVLVSEDESADVRITGRPSEAVQELQSELKRALAL